MIYSITLSRRAAKEVLRLDAGTFARIKSAIDILAEAPRPPGVRKLQGREDDWRIRVGSFRILYTIDDTRHLMLIRLFQHTPRYCA